MRQDKVINELKASPSGTYYSFFKVGSAKEFLEEGGDLDLIFVIKESQKDKFFDTATKILKKLKKKDNRLDYTFFRGPIKYQGKKLIQMVVYTMKQFINENQPVLKSYLKSAEIIKGLTVKTLLKDVKFNKVKTNQLKMERKWKNILRENKINFPEWIKTKVGWELKRTEIILDEFQRDYWKRYISKFKK